MRKTLFLLLFSCFMLTQVVAQEASKGIDFRHGSWAEVLQEAKKENKLIFIDAYTTWCGPCKWMAANVFPDQEVAKYFNENFINYKSDMEKGEGITIAKKYRVAAYPSFLFVNGDGRLVYKFLGSRQPKEFIADAAKSMEPTEQFMEVPEGNTPKLLKDYYANMDRKARLDSEKARELLRKMPPHEWASEAGFNLIFHGRPDISSEAFRWVVTERGELAKMFGKEDIDGLVRNTFYGNAAKAAKDKDDAAFDQVVAAVHELMSNEDATPMVGELKMFYYSRTKDWSAYVSAADDYFASQEEVAPNALNSAAWTVYENVEDPLLLDRGLGWVNRAVEKAPDFFNLDTQAALFFKLGRIAEGKTAALAAIEKAKEAGMEAKDYKGTQELIEKYTKGN